MRTDGDDGDKDAELERDRAPTRQIAPDKGPKQREGQEAPNILSPLNADSLHPHIVKLSLLFCGVGDHVRQAGM